MYNIVKKISKLCLDFLNSCKVLLISYINFLASFCCQFTLHTNTVVMEAATRYQANTRPALITC